MDADRSAVLTGVFLLLGTVVGVIGLGVVLEQLNSATDSLTVYGESETRVAVASLVELFTGVVLVGMAIAVYPVLKKFSPSAAIANIGARLLEGVIYIILVLSMLALAGLGRDYIAAGSPSDSYFQVAGGLLLVVPDWAGHGILDVAIFPLGAVILYAVFYRVEFVPRWLSVWGLAGAVLYWVAGFLVMFHFIAPLESVHVMLQAPLGLQEVVLAIWLMAKGFNASALASVAWAGGSGGSS
jgi:hypothetical protein